MKVMTMVLGPIGTNCYVIRKEDEKEVLIVDPASQAALIEQKLDELGAVPAATLLTHGHFDHIGAVDGLRERYGCPVYALRQEKETLQDPSLNQSLYHGASITVEADQYLTDGQELKAGPFTLKVLHTPGHTPGGTCYYMEDEKVLFSGDTLFCESVGRTDFPGGSMSALVRGIREKLMTLPDETVVCPGHGPASTIGHEKAYNPFL